MDKTLIIVESPAKARTISKFLGKKYEVKASRGHVRDLPRSQFGVEVEDGFKPKYITIRGKGPVLKELRQEKKKAQRVLVATDPDREGEAIAWHLAQALEVPEEESCRVEFNEVTRESVRQAVAQPRPLDFRRVDAQQARRILDRLVGYNLSPLLWDKVKRGLSAGRVQSVALRLVCQREREIQDFSPQEYWTLDVVLRTEKGEVFRAQYYGRTGKKQVPATEAQTQAIISRTAGLPFQVQKVQNQEKKKQPPYPFTTSSLQQEAARRLGFPVRKTMRLAQQLYEGVAKGKKESSGLITYIRTDSTRVSPGAAATAADYVKREWGSEFVGRRRGPAKKGQGVQDAHEAIRPTDVGNHPQDLKEHLARDQLRLYRLIWERFLASNMSPARYNALRVDIQAGEHVFRATGSTLLFPGFLKLYAQNQADEPRAQKIPELTEGQELEVLEFEPGQHFTQPPPRYTEATLVKILEEKGIGRPSTYAPTIDTIQQRGYVVVEERKLVPTELGLVVIDALQEYFPNLLDVEFTAHMERELDEVETGHREWRDVLDRFYQSFLPLVERAHEEMASVQVADEETDEICPQCGGNLVVKHGRYGKFLACPAFPGCRFTKPLLSGTGVYCPRCEQEIVERRSKKGRKFYGCSGYPDCTFVLWQEPAGRSCPQCGEPMVWKRARGKKPRHRCSNAECKFETDASTRGEEVQASSVAASNSSGSGASGQ